MAKEPKSVNEPAPAEQLTPEQQAALNTPESINEPPGSDVTPPVEPPVEPPPDPEPEGERAEYDEAWEREDDDRNEATGKRKPKRR